MRRTVVLAVALCAASALLAACAPKSSVEDGTVARTSAPDGSYATASAFGVSVDGLGLPFVDFEGAAGWNVAIGGWTNGPLTRAGAPYALELCASTARGGHERGETVGVVIVDVDDAGNWTLSFDTLPGYVLLEVHGYVGPTDLPLVRRGDRAMPVTDPSGYPEEASFAFDSRVSETALVADSRDDEVSVIVNAVVVALPTIRGR